MGVSLQLNQDPASPGARDCGKAGLREGRKERECRVAGDTCCVWGGGWGGGGFTIMIS